MGPRRIGRSARLRPQFQRILVLCEGQCTEPQYLHEVRRERRIPEQNLTIIGPSKVPNTPREMVEEAKRRKRVRIEPYDQVWCVFDVEAKLTQKCRDGLLEAPCSAGDAGILIAMSNPCFEVWLCWHMADQTAWVASDVIQARCKELGIIDGKQIQDSPRLIREFYRSARKRASSSDQAHERSGTKKPEDRNPSSGVYQLIDAIRAAFQRSE
jgi:hypothetical protein